MNRTMQAPARGGVHRKPRAARAGTEAMRCLHELRERRQQGDTAADKQISSPTDHEEATAPPPAAPVHAGEPPDSRFITEEASCSWMTHQQLDEAVPLSRS